MFRLHNLAAGAILVLTAAAPAAAQDIDPSFRADIEKLMELTGAARSGAQMANFVAGRMLDGLKQSQPDVPPRALEVAKEVINTEITKAFNGPDSVTAKMVAIYARHFTDDEVRGLLAFYQSDLGRKTVQELPALLQEGAQVGQEWATKNMPRIIELVMSRLKSEGLLGSSGKTPGLFD